MPKREAEPRTRSRMSRGTKQLSSPIFSRAWRDTSPATTRVVFQCGPSMRRTISPALAAANSRPRATGCRRKANGNTWPGPDRSPLSRSRSQGTSSAPVHPANSRSTFSKPSLSSVRTPIPAPCPPESDRRTAGTSATSTATSRNGVGTGSSPRIHRELPSITPARSPGRFESLVADRGYGRRGLAGRPRA